MPGGRRSARWPSCAGLEWRPSDASADQSNFEVRLGLSTGLAIIAEGGASSQLPALGEPVTVAGRLAAEAQPGQILMGEDTYRAAYPYFVIHPVARGLLPEPWHELLVFSVQGRARFAPGCKPWLREV